MMANRSGSKHTRKTSRKVKEASNVRWCRWCLCLLCFASRTPRGRESQKSRRKCPRRSIVTAEVRGVETLEPSTLNFNKQLRSSRKKDCLQPLLLLFGASPKQSFAPFRVVPTTFKEFSSGAVELCVCVCVVRVH